jgi:uncharacterized protein (TIGR02271 family)
MSSDETTKLQLVEETVSLEKQEVVTGRVRVSTATTLVDEVARATLSGEQVDVTRHRIDRDVTDVPAVRTEGDTTIIPVVEEVVVIEKRLVLVEEIHIRRIATSEDVAVPVTLRKQHAVIEQLNPENQEH